MDWLDKICEDGYASWSPTKAFVSHYLRDRIRAAHAAEVERVTAELKQENEENFALITKQSNLLTATVNALRGDPPDDVLWSHHDIPDLAKELRERIERLEEAKNTAYAERQKMVQSLTFIFPAHMKRHPDSDSEWEDDWRNIVCIHGPAGQMTWHIHDSEAGMFGHLNRKPDPFEGCEYDGHTTPEKYDRLLRSVLQRFCMGAADAAEGEDDE